MEKSAGDTHQGGQSQNDITVPDVDNDGRLHIGSHPQCSTTGVQHSATQRQRGISLRQVLGAHKTTDARVLEAEAGISPIQATLDQAIL